jgi:hypothetical protein
MAIAVTVIFSLAFDNWLLGVVAGIGAALGIEPSLHFDRSQPTMPDDPAG